MKPALITLWCFLKRRRREDNVSPGRNEYFVLSPGKTAKNHVPNLAAAGGRAAVSKARGILGSLAGLSTRL